MGIRGLTTYIARNSDRYFENYKLHDTYLVIDGNNIASHLYVWHCKSNDCFGGDYDKYANTIKKFFTILSECNVIPIIVLDGAYEKKKMKTVFSRLRSRLDCAKRLNSSTEGSICVFPLFLRELFVDILIELKVKTVRCKFEGDYEIACLARNLKCPVLSYDSDFYVFDVLYIPFNSFEMQVKSEDKIKYVQCNIYRIEKFLRSFGGLNKQEIPLLAVLLGNDYIGKKVFANFYSQMKLAKKRNAKSDEQRKIEAVVRWLKEETFESAVRKVLGGLKVKKRKRVASHINDIMNGYSCLDSKMISLLNIDGLDLKKGTKDCLDVDLNVNNESEEIVSSDNESEDLIADAPDWFLNNFYLCKYPSCFLDMYYKNTYYCLPQIEDYSNTCSHTISLDILSQIHGIITSGNAKEFVYIGRRRGSLKRFVSPAVTGEIVPKLDELPLRTKAENKEFILDVLKVGRKFVDEVLSMVPPSWHLFLISIHFWAENASPKIFLSHIYALILSAIINKHCDRLVGFCRSTKKFLDKFENKAQILISKPKADAQKDVFLKDITYDDSLLCLRETVNFFQMNAKMKTSDKFYDISVVDNFAQFQSVLLHTKHLNSLLDEPFENIVISDFYDGTFIYNMTVTLMQQNSIENYLNNLLKDSDSILISLQKIMDKLRTNFEVENNTPNAGNKRKRRRKKKEKFLDVKVEELSMESSDESEDDTVLLNNRFSLLKVKNQ